MESNGKHLKMTLENCSRKIGMEGVALVTYAAPQRRDHAPTTAAVQRVVEDRTDHTHSKDEHQMLLYNSLGGRTIPKAACVGLAMEAEAPRGGRQCQGRLQKTTM